jgi:ribosomal protein L40E
MEKETTNVGYPDQAAKRKKLRVAGFISLGIGTTSMAIGIASLFSAMDGGFPNLFFLTFVGMPFEFVGGVLLMFGYLGAVSRFQAGEAAPVAKDTANYLLDGTREETAKTVGAVAKNVKSSGPICPKCGTLNEVGASYCDHCGASLNKTCSHCGEKNDPDSTYCRKCGEHL